ncbi:MAG: thioredoxin family protein [Candidatus Kariarchaeaceae archaeon]|jgi:hypothetical protein
MDVELKNNSRKRGKHIQVFSDGCNRCQNHISNVEVGKCAGCKLEVHQFDLNSAKTNELSKKYNVSVHPTTIIDDEIKVEGMPKFYWQCGDDFYHNLKEDFPLKLKSK